MVTVKALPAAALLALALLPARAAGPGETAAPAGSLVVRKWIALDEVDARARVPFNANTPLLRYLLDRAAAPPKAGEKAKGAAAESAWRAVEAREDGTVEDENGAWFYGEVEAPAPVAPGDGKAPAESVWLARLEGASALFVNGAAFPGDVYRLGTGPVPVSLRGGVNRLFVAGPRGPWRLRLEPWEEGRSPLLAEDATLPDLVSGAVPRGKGSFRLVNPSTEWVAGAGFPVLMVEGGPFFPASPFRPDEPAVAPLWTGKATAGFGPGGAAGSVAGPVVEFGVVAATDLTGKVRRIGRAQRFRIEVREPREPRRVTFTSRIDGTVQYYGLLPESESDLPAAKVGTVLSLHGAGVEAIGQVRAYSPRPDFRIVAPTNRRPYGFDWQDWGRLDAYEVLQDAMTRSGGDGSRVYLTGHSMGGHGVWHLAANDPGRWAAIAPSAGWCSFGTYAGGRPPETPLSPFWRAADGGSRTEDLVAGLAPIPTYVLHGAKDEVVPLSEAEGMLKRLEAAGGKPLHHFQEGAAHWWDVDPAPGADCVDWPGIFDLFRAAAPVRAASPGRPSMPPGPGGSGGPFKRAFDDGFVLVVGTKGTEEENREMLELARYHAGQWWYRANGSAPVLRDTDFLAAGPAGREGNVILYGNADVNGAWKALLPAGCPLEVRRGSLRLGERTWKGEDLGAVFVHPRADAPSFLVGAFASTGARGTRVGYGLLPFTPGVGYPDYAVFGEEFLRSGDGGVRAAGWFDQRWGLQAGGFVQGENR